MKSAKRLITTTYHIQNKHNSSSQCVKNTHELYVVSLDQLKALIRDRNDLWEKYKQYFEVQTNYVAPGLDIMTATRLVSDLGVFNAKVAVKTYSGKQHIIISGRAGLRKILTGTKYGITHPKIVQLGIGRAGVINAVAEGGIITIVLLTVYRVLDFFLTDNSTLTRLIGTIATDIVKIGIASGVTIGLATSVGLTVGTTMAVGPMLVVIIVGVTAAAGLNYLDTRYGITESVIAGLNTFTYEAGKYMTKRKKMLESSPNLFAPQFILPSGDCSMPYLI